MEFRLMGCVILRVIMSVGRPRLEKKNATKIATPDKVRAFTVHAVLRVAEPLSRCKQRLGLWFGLVEVVCCIIHGFRAFMAFVGSSPKDRALLRKQLS